jgi:hypothetical protein
MALAALEGGGGNGRNAPLIGLQLHVHSRPCPRLTRVERPASEVAWRAHHEPEAGLLR